MPVMGPKENEQQVERAYKFVMLYLQRRYGIQKFPETTINFLNPELRIERTAEFKEALRRLFELDAWEGF